MEIRTSRLLLRPWKDEDLPQIIAVNSDPDVMEFVDPTLTPEQSEAMISRARQSWNENGFGLFAVEAPGVADLIGFVGLAIPRFESHFTPAVEIGWRLLSPYWGHGYATEGANAVKEFAFKNLCLEEIVSFTSAQNLRSRNVMEKIGLKRNPNDDFEHPNISPDNPLRAHVLYRGTPNVS